MVRPHFWRVAGVVFPLTILQSILENTGDDAGHALLGEGYLGNWLGSVASNLLGAPLYALTVLALYFEIRAREEGQGGRAQPASSVLTAAPSAPRSVRRSPTSSRCRSRATRNGVPIVV